MQNEFHTNTIYNIAMKWVSTVVVITMNSNIHIDWKQELTFCAEWVSYKYNLQCRNEIGK